MKLLPDLHPGPEWGRAAVSVKVPEGAEYLLFSVMIANGYPGQKLYIDDVVIEEKPQEKLKHRAGNPVVGVYNVSGQADSSEGKILAALRSGGMNARLVASLKKEELDQIDVLVLPSRYAGRKLAPADMANTDTGAKQIDYVGTLLNFVDGGGGLILCHDTVGMRGLWKTPLFPEVSSGIQIVNERNLQTAGSHPIVKGVPKQYQTSYFDHIRIRPGAKADVLLKDESGAAAAAAGRVSRGKVVAIGYCMGSDTKNRIADLNEVEKAFLLNAVKWAVSDRYDVPQVLTDARLLPGYSSRNAVAGKQEMQRRKTENEWLASLPKPGRFDESIILNFSYFFDLKDKPAMLERIVGAKKMGFTTISLQGTHGTRLFFNSDEFPECMGAKSGILDFMVPEARKHGLKVRISVFPTAWGNYCPHCRNKVKPALEVSLQERKLLDQGKITWNDLRKNRDRGFCISNPYTYRRAEKLCGEIIRKYDPDILGFDFIRYISGTYFVPCKCDDCVKKQGSMSDADFARQELLSFYKRLAAFCRKVKPSIRLDGYTFSGDHFVFEYPFDFHDRYVTRELSPAWPAERIEKDLKKYSELLLKVNPRCHILPIIGCEDHKDAKRIYGEIAALSLAYDKLKIKPKIFALYNWNKICSGGKLDPQIAQAVSDALGGTWGK